MKGSLAASLILHAGILVAALIVLPNPKYEVKPTEFIAVDITQISDVTRKMAMAKDAEPTDKKPAPKKTENVQKADPQKKVAEEVKKAAKEPKPEPPPPEKKPEPKPEKKPEPPKKAEEPKPLDPDPLKALIKDTVDEEPPKKKEEPKKAEQAKKPEKKPDKKPEKKKPEKLDVDQMEAFLNKIDGESTAPVETTQLDGAPAKGEANMQGSDTQLSATAIDALRSRIRECWVVPPGAREANITVKVRFMLNQDGSVSGVPEVMNGTGDPLFDATARSAVAAILGCQAYSFMPPEQYDAWKDLILNFNPNMMFDS